VIRLVVLVLIVVLAVWLIRRALRGPSAGPDQASGQPDDELVSCARCGLHMPRAEAKLRDGALFCSEEHARLGRKP
jgi:uncharacterized protein